MRLSTKILGIISLLIIAASPFLHGQIIWQEQFNYPDSTLIGANNNTANPAADWTVSCPTCVANDWYAVYNNLLEGRDTNGPAVFLTEVIDISAFSDVQLSLKLSESGTMEDCTNSSCGCGCIDWILLEYSLDGGGFVQVPSALGGTCPNTCATENYLTLGNFATFVHTECPLSGNSIQVRITVQTWAGSEYLQIDSLVVSNQTCVLPAGLQYFEAVLKDDQSAMLSWALEDEGAYEYFVVERRANEGPFEALTQLSADQSFLYQYEDNALSAGIWSYRLGMVDGEGNTSYSDLRTLRIAPQGEHTLQVSPNPFTSELLLKTSGEPIQAFKLMDLHGKTVIEQAGFEQEELSLILTPFPKGLYILQVTTDEAVYTQQVIKLPSP